MSLRALANAAGEMHRLGAKCEQFLSHDSSTAIVSSAVQGSHCRPACSTVASDKGRCFPFVGWCFDVSAGTSPLQVTSRQVPPTLLRARAWVRSVDQTLLVWYEVFAGPKAERFAHTMYPSSTETVRSVEFVVRFMHRFFQQRGSYTPCSSDSRRIRSFALSLSIGVNLPFQDPNFRDWMRLIPLLYSRCCGTSVGPALSLSPSYNLLRGVIIGVQAFLEEEDSRLTIGSYEKVSWRSVCCCNSSERAISVCMLPSTAGCFCCHTRTALALMSACSVLKGNPLDSPVSGGRVVLRTCERWFSRGREVIMTHVPAALLPRRTRSTREQRLSG